MKALNVHKPMRPKVPATINSCQCDSESYCVDSSIPELIPVISVYQIRIHISRDEILHMCTKFYKNNNEKFGSDSKISLILASDSI